MNGQQYTFVVLTFFWNAGLFWFFNRFSFYFSFHKSRHLYYFPLPSSFYLFIPHSFLWKSQFASLKFFYTIHSLNFWYPLLYDGSYSGKFHRKVKFFIPFYLLFWWMFDLGSDFLLHFHPSIERWKSLFQFISLYLVNWFELLSRFDLGSDFLLYFLLIGFVAFSPFCGGSSVERWNF